MPAAVWITIAVVGGFAAPFAVQSTGLVDFRFPTTPTATASPSVTRTSGSIPLCSGGNRAERRLTCIVDGDTGWHEGINWRLVGRSSGVDAPEISRPECSAERAAGDRATARLRELMAGGYDLVETGMDRYGRVLARITLADGRDAGDTLIREGHAQECAELGEPVVLKWLKFSDFYSACSEKQRAARFRSRASDVSRT